MDLILASTSPYRRALIERLGVPFRCCAPEVDEEKLKADWGAIAPRELAERLATCKAASISRREPLATVIGGDQLVSFQGQILGKPGSSEQAVTQLLASSGQTQELITALVVMHADQIFAHTNVTRMTLRHLTQAEVRRYVDTDHPMDCAGSFKWESRGIALFEEIDSDDESAIVGVPLIALATILRTIGYAIP